MYANFAISIEFWNSKKWDIWIWRGLFNRVVSKSSSLVCIAETTSGNWNGDGWFSCTRRVSPLLLWCTVFCTVAVKWKINTFHWLLIHWHRFILPVKRRQTEYNLFEMIDYYQSSGRPLSGYFAHGKTFFSSPLLLILHLNSCRGIHIACKSNWHFSTVAATVVDVIVFDTFACNIESS